MRKLIYLGLALLVSFASAQHKKFGDAGIVKDTLSKQFTTAQVYRDTTGKRLVFTDLKIMMDAPDRGLFENGNPLSNTTALIIRNLTQKELDAIVNIKRMLESTMDRDGKKIELTPDQLENLQLRVMNWLSERKVGK